jgi:hypothetical protein
MDPSLGCRDVIGESGVYSRKFPDEAKKAGAAVMTIS